MKLRIGLVWFDNAADKSFSDKVLGAAAYFQHKYGKEAELCYVHPSAIAPFDEVQVGEHGEITVRGSRSVLPNHFFIGLDPD